MASQKRTHLNKAATRSGDLGPEKITELQKKTKTEIQKEEKHKNTVPEFRVSDRSIVSAAGVL
jgi:hypothetical protein